ncbi:MAG: ABC transporter permease [Cytophagales bacterium]|nr:ABC transporter permease [Cytophagales bacterium]
MNLPLFISRRIAKNESGSFSSTIHRIAVVSISISLMALIVAYMVLYGFQGAIRDKVFNLSGHLTVNKYALSNSFEETSILASDSLMHVLTSHENIRHVQRFVLKAGLLKTDEEVQGIILKGVGSDFDTANFSTQMIDGVFPDFEGEKYSTDVAISDKIANLLRLQVNEKVTIFFAQQPPRYRRLTVTGIYSTGMEEFDDRFIFGDIDMIRRINDWSDQQAGGIEVFLEDESQIEAMEGELFNTLDIDLNVISSYRQYPQIFEWLKLLDRNVLVLLALIVFVASFGMISMVLILIMERTRMVGMMKALGSADQMIRKVFLYSGLQLIAKGLIIGNVLGLMICWLQYEFQLIPLDAANYYMHFVPVIFDWPTIIGLNVMIVVMVGLTLFIPIRVVSSIEPIKAIRFD